MSDREPHIDRVATLKTTRPGDARWTMFGVLRAIRAGTTRAGRPFVDAELSDASGSVPLKIWEDAHEAMAAAQDLQEGEVVKVLFLLEEYRGAKPVSYTHLRAHET